MIDTLPLASPSVRTPQASAKGTSRQAHPSPYARDATLDFVLPNDLHASSPPEARGIARDAVRLMVSSSSSERVRHTQFFRMGEFLRTGDVLVINTSGTRSAALPALGNDGAKFELHLSTQLPNGRWLVELRCPGDHGTQPFFDARIGDSFTLPAGGSVTLIAPHDHSNARSGRTRLWTADLELPETVDPYLAAHGAPIRYGYVREPWPIEYYQTVFATELGSAEMPSAGRPFTRELISRLIAQGVQIAPLILHTGVSSPEVEEAPYEEYYRVPPATAAIVNAARASGRPVIAIGTTAVRGRVHSAEGWTDLVVTPARGVRVVNGLLTGLHEPRASHLQMLEAIAARRQLRRAYAEALSERYLWHEFGDVHLILP